MTLTRLLLLLLCATVALPAAADSWMAPQPATVTSQDAAYRLTVFPPPRGPVADGETPPGCIATLEQLEGNAYVERWRKPLPNPIAPASVLVDGQGRFVTFDDWGRVGFGDNVVAIYAADGTLVKKYGLEQLLSPEQLAAVPNSVSSRWWGRQHRIDHDGALVLVLAEGRDAEGNEISPERELRLDMATGERLPDATDG